MFGRVLIAVGALLLIGTAAFHALGGTAISGWLGGERATVLQILWHVPALDWAAVGLGWLFLAWRGTQRFALLVWLLALVPAGAAAMIGALVGPYLVIFWLLAGATLLALLGSIALPRERSS